MPTRGGGKVTNEDGKYPVRIEHGLMRINGGAVWINCPLDLGVLQKHSEKIDFLLEELDLDRVIQELRSEASMREYSEQERALALAEGRTPYIIVGPTVPPPPNPREDECRLFREMLEGIPSEK